MTSHPSAKLQRLISGLVATLATAFFLLPLLAPPGALAGSVEWREVPATAAGRQWWDYGSLRQTRDGHLSVLTRFQPAATEESASRLSDLYVMEIDCGQQLYRDTSVNGIPQWRATWQPAGSEDLIGEVVQASCTAGEDLLLQAG